MSKSVLETETILANLRDSFRAKKISLEEAVDEAILAIENACVKADHVVIPGSLTFSKPSRCLVDMKNEYPLDNQAIRTQAIENKLNMSFMKFRSDYEKAQRKREEARKNRCAK